MFTSTYAFIQCVTVLSLSWIFIVCLYRYYFINRNLFYVQEMIIKSIIRITCKYTLSASGGFNKPDGGWKALSEALDRVAKDSAVLTLSDMFNKTSIMLTQRLHRVGIDDPAYNDIVNAQLNLVYLEKNISGGLQDHQIGLRFKVRVKSIRRIIDKWP